MVQEAHDRLGRIDVFVHAVGRNVRRPVLEMAGSDWSDMLTVNLSTAYWCGQGAGRVMCEQGRGRVVFLSSVSGLLAQAEHAPYAAPKGGLNQLLRVIVHFSKQRCGRASPGLATDDAAHITGGYLVADGGYNMGRRRLQHGRRLTAAWSAPDGSTVGA